jgi:antitoxin VapB
MRARAKIFSNGRSQAVRLPMKFRFDVKEVYIYQNQETGDIVLSKKPDSWDDFFNLLENIKVPKDFLSDRDNSPAQQRNLF